jgi:hypothetical protein
VKEIVMNKKTKLILAALGAVAAALTVAVVSAAGSPSHVVSSQTGAITGQMRAGHGYQAGGGAGARAQMTARQSAGPRANRGVGIRAFDAGAVRLTSTEASGLRYMVEEEKFAHDVYTVLAERYPDAPFAVIAQSEQRHQAAVQRLIARAGLTDPTSSRAAGVFDNANLQRLYNTLVKRGTASRAAALQVGALIERTDIADLQARSNATTDAAIKRVYGHLEQASRQHLRIFVTDSTRTA